MNTHIIHPKYQKSYKVDNNSDFTKMLGSNHLEEHQIKPNVKMVIPKYFNDSNGFALGCFKDKLLFSKAIFIGDSEQELKALLMDVYWLGYDPELKNTETKRIAFLNA